MELIFFVPSGLWSLETPLKLHLERTERGHQFTMRINLKRNADYYVLVIVLPVLLLILLSFVPFLLPFSGGEKVGTGLTVFSAFIVELLVISEVLPATGPEDLPIIAEIISILIVMVFVSVVISTLLTSMYAKNSKFPKYLKTFLDLSIVRMFCSYRTECFVSQNFGDTENETQT